MISRRNVLRGAGVALSLPFMESLVPREARADAMTPPKRFIPIYFPNGAGLEWWDFKGTGKAWMPGPLLRPIMPVKSKTMVVKNIGNYSWRRDLLKLMPEWFTSTPRVDLGTLMPMGSYILPAHSRQPGAMLNCVDGDGIRSDLKVDIATSPFNAITVDQVIAQKLAGQTAIKSLQLGLLDGSGEFDQRNSVFSQNMSWSDTKTPMGKDKDPQHVFDVLVAGGATKPGSTTDPAAMAAAAHRRALDKSALDSLKASTGSLQTRLSTADKAQLDQFLTGVRDLEQRASAVAQPAAAMGCNPIARPDVVTDPIKKMGVMNDLIVMALQCDATRVVSYMLDNSRSELIYGHVKMYDYTKDVPLTGTAGDYHQSQHAGLRNATFASITNWQVSVAADLAQKLDKVTEGTGTLLDHSLLMLFSDMHHGDHAAFDLPLLFMGGAGTFRQDELVVLPEDAKSARQLRDLYFTILNSYFKLGITSFGEDVRQLPNALIQDILA